MSTMKFPMVGHYLTSVEADTERRITTLRMGPSEEVSFVVDEAQTLHDDPLDIVEQAFARLREDLDRQLMKNHGAEVKSLLVGILETVELAEVTGYLHCCAIRRDLRRAISMVTPDLVTKASRL